MNTLLALAIAAPVSLYAHEGRPRSVGVGDVPFEIVGQVLNSPGPPATSLQFGYLSSIQGLEGIYTTTDPTLQNESTALFTFFNDSVTQRVIFRGGLRIINRVGITRIYFDDTPDGDLINPDPESFADGTLIQTSTFRHQVILDSTTNKFTTVFVNVVTDTRPFVFNGERVKLGKVNDRIRIWVSGLPIDPPARFDIAGYAVGAGRAFPDPQDAGD
jgi:hypothetical protein